MTTKLFTPDDINNLTLLTHLQDTTTPQCQRELTKFIGMFQEQSTAARILHKEAIPKYLSTFTTSVDKPKISLKSRVSQIFKEELPHMAKSLGLTPEEVVKPVEVKPTTVMSKFNIGAP